MPKTTSNSSPPKKSPDRSRRGSASAAAMMELPQNSRIVQPSYIEKNTGTVRIQHHPRLCMIYRCVLESPIKL
jgi:hypothetical protein